jgi:hypothetical protein
MSLARENSLGQGVADILGRCQAIKQSAYVRIPCYTEATVEFPLIYLTGLPLLLRSRRMLEFSFSFKKLSSG